MLVTAPSRCVAARFGNGEVTAFNPPVPGNPVALFGRVKSWEHFKTSRRPHCECWD